MAESPFRNYDAWLERPFQDMCAAQEAEAEAWDEFCLQRNGPDDQVVLTINGPQPAPPRIPVVPVEAYEEDHTDHDIYKAWLELESAITRRFDRLEAEAYYEDDGDEAEAKWTAIFTRPADIKLHVLEHNDPGLLFDRCADCHQWIYPDSSGDDLTWYTTSRELPLKVYECTPVDEDATRGDR